uniref:Uncharacterized protein n=1 Tax=Trichuris muris TaxID=70415 RepID=A0A5S6R2P1_TRIMR
MSKIALLLLLPLLACKADMDAFTDKTFDIISKAIATIPGGYRPYEPARFFGRRNACEALAEMADFQMKWTRNAKIQPAALRVQYLRALRQIKREAAAVAMRPEYQARCRRMMRLFRRGI